MNPETLLPCPFCGHKEIDPAEWMSEDGSGPGCPECGALADSVEKWNMRALLSPPEVPGGEYDPELLADSLRMFSHWESSRNYSMPEDAALEIFYAYRREKGRVVQ